MEHQYYIGTFKTFLNLLRYISEKESQRRFSLWFLGNIPLGVIAIFRFLTFQLISSSKCYENIFSCFFFILSLKIDLNFSIYPLLFKAIISWKKDRVNCMVTFLYFFLDLPGGPINWPVFIRPFVRLLVCYEVFSRLIH